MSEARHITCECCWHGFSNMRSNSTGVPAKASDGIVPLHVRRVKQMTNG